MLFAHISDFHVFAGEPGSPLVRRDFRPAFAKIIDDINAFDPAIEAVMFTGDLVDGGTAEDYSLVKDIMSALKMPYYSIPGNHDRRDTFRKAFENDLPFEDDVFLHYETFFGNTRILALDTVIDGSAAGALCPKRLDWIGEKLGTPHDGATLILMHHAPYISNLGFFDDIGLIEGRAAFADLVRGFKGPTLRILSGHIHRPSFTCWNGAFAMIAGSPSFTVVLDLKAHTDEPPVFDAPYVYFVHSSEEPAQFAVHPRLVRF
ncbi:MAG: metallophosphoesterase [Methylobacteriaceae bacterium]|jgi:3',5'-cyclic AMP phosphodiesterase CpdA|nr:metallophosphoesterase [Methylobacteriaceae bacterium]